ncbi:hypothetical protein [Brevibacillus sp. H7]|uniref:hypothetical protein n=1 Tax=Brevibacillus sp. H7 TaxID=3349138 RepID=UPI003820757F
MYSEPLIRFSKSVRLFLIVIMVLVSSIGMLPSRSLAVTYAPDHVVFLDTDPDEGEIGGTISWESRDTEGVASYVITASTTYHADQAVIAEVPLKDSKFYSYSIPENTKLPENAVKLNVKTKFANGELADEWMVCALIDNTSSATPQAANLPTAKRVVFTDYDYLSNDLFPMIRVEGAEDETNITHYVLYYLDDKGEKLQQIGQVAKEESWLMKLPRNVQMPEKAKAIGVYSKGPSGESTGRVTTGIWNIPNHLPRNVMFTDTDPDQHEIGGTLTWERATDESNITSYQIYFGSIDGKKFFIDEVAAGKSAYSYQIPENTMVPDEATRIEIYAANAFGECSDFGTQTIIQSDAPSAETIIVRNNPAGMDD